MCTHWCDYIQDVINIITVKPEEYRFNQQTRIMNQENFPLRIRDVSLPQDVTGHLHFAISKMNNFFGYVDTTMILRSTLFRHNQGFGGSNLLVELRPHVLISYVCGFQSNKNKINDVARAQKDEIIDDMSLWARNSRNIIQYYAELNLVYIMRE